MKLDETSLTKILGEPVFERRDFQTRLLRYQGETCRVAAFLYRDKGTGPWLADHIEAQDGDGAKQDLTACLKRFVRESDPAKAG